MKKIFVQIIFLLGMNVFFTNLSAYSENEIIEKKYQKIAIENLNQKLEETLMKYKLKFFMQKIFKQTFPTMWDYYTQTIMHYDVELLILPDKGVFDAKGSIKVRILLQETEKLSFLMEGSIYEISMDGNPLQYKEYDLDLYGYKGLKYVEIKLPQKYKKGDFLVLNFHTQGKPNCESSFIFDIKVCKFSPSLTYTGISSVLPWSIGGDFFTSDIRLIIPKGYVVGSTGNVVEVKEKDEKTEIHHIVQEFPTGTYAFGFSSFKESLNKYGEKLIKILYNDSDELFVNKALKDSEDILNFYSKRYGEFIYPKMEIIEIDNNAGAAFGWPMLLWIPEYGFSIDLIQSTALLAHEIGHQWWPHMLMNGENNAPWLSEGFAEYSSVSYMKSLLGESYEKGIYYSYALLYQYYVKPINDFPLSKIDFEKLKDPYAYVIVTYYKGAIVTSILEKILGEEIFLQAINSLYNDYAGKEKYYYTETLKEKLEKSYGKSLNWFFNKWVYDIGYPIYRIGLRREEKNGSNYALIDILNTPSAGETSFIMPVDIIIVTSSGEEKFELFVDEKEETFEFEVKDYPLRVRFDPERKFMHRTSGKIQGDIDLSGDVDGIDLIYVAWAYGSTIFESENFFPSADLNFDMSVDNKDLDIVINNFGEEYKIEGEGK